MSSPIQKTIEFVFNKEVVSWNYRREKESNIVVDCDHPLFRERFITALPIVSQLESLNFIGKMTPANSLFIKRLIQSFH